MNFFYPTAGMPGMKIFAGTMPLIYQSGGQLYGDTIHRTELNNNQTIEGVRLLTEMFTIYNVPYDVPSFYQQFRDGSIPIGISDYYMYNLILNAAPEIKNVWDIALFRELKMNRVTSSAGQRVALKVTSCLKILEKLMTPGPL
ncbi:hypothetical protein [Halolactibacillus sp. JCM 19043]|uniref:hypothetical protein n=1 Tax=Halolactibacillus sp. JCM 19043 TaxID=1460638 RepID=UPI0007806D48|nr:hypothetical protein [Halolactibacillus sp. JCM 19043]